MANAPGEAGAIVGFLGLFETQAQDGYIGAILVTDLRGIPQEFRCTRPVKPTAIQRPLYGESMEPYIGVEVCGKSLIRSVEHTLSLLLVNRQFLLDVRAACNCPVVFVREVGEAIDVAPDDDSEPSREKIDSPTGRFSPVVFSWHREFDGDRDSARPLLENALCYMNPAEPFARAAKAIGILGTQDKRFQ